MVGIVTNSAALFAQRNLDVAAGQSELSIGRLSSGQAIIRAADDVSGLAIGTTIGTTISTLRAVLTSTSQANSLLAVADGGLQNINDILQRQKSLAVSANSGTVSDNERAFLNQEFTNLSAEIDRIVDSTTFNGIKLIDGSIFDQAALTTNTADAGTAASSSITIDGNVSDGDAIFITDGTTSRQITFSTNGEGGADLNIGAGGTASASAAQTLLLDYFQSVKDTDPFFQQFEIGTAFASNVLTISAKNTGTGGNSFEISAVNSTGEAAATNIDIAGTNGATKVAFTGGVNGDLFAGRVDLDEANDSVGDALLSALTTTAQSFSAATLTLAATPANDDSITITVRGVAETFTFGTDVGEIGNAVGDDADDALRLVEAINGSALAQFIQAAVDPESTNAGVVELNSIFAGNITIATSAATNVTAASTNGAGSGVYVTDVVNNEDFVGTISGFSATFNGADNVTASVTVGDITYTATIEDTTPGIDQQIRFESTESGINGGGFFDVFLSSSNTQAVTDQDDANVFANRLEAAFSTLTFYQTRDLASSSFIAAGDVFTGSTRTAALAGSSLDVTHSDFSDLQIADVTVAAPANGATDGKITITLASGEVFETASGITDGVATSTTFNLTSTTNPQHIIAFTTGSTNVGGGEALKFETDEQAQSLEAALESSFGLGAGQGGLSFQVGEGAADTINVALNSAQTADIFKDDNGVFQDLDISTAAGAITASAVLDNAISSVTSLRAAVGALQSRFDFAAANISTSVQNQEAARSDFLDVDVAQESTEFATAQVRLQASISVLAQANQIPQNLLKLIG